MLELLIGLFGTAIFATFGFVYQKQSTLESRVTRLETQHEDLSTLLDAKLDPILQRLERIERAMNGALKGH